MNQIIIYIGYEIWWRIISYFVRIMSKNGYSTQMHSLPATMEFERTGLCIERSFGKGDLES